MAFLVFAAVCVVLVPLSYRRSGSMTHYLPGTGAPVMWVLLLGSSLLSWVVALVGDESTAVQLFVGALIGTAFVQVHLMRRQARPSPGRDDESD